MAPALQVVPPSLPSHPTQTVAKAAAGAAAAQNSRRQPTRFASIGPNLVQLWPVKVLNPGSSDVTLPKTYIWQHYPNIGSGQPLEVLVKVPEQALAAGMAAAMTAAAAGGAGTGEDLVFRATSAVSGRNNRSSGPAGTTAGGAGNVAHTPLVAAAAAGVAGGLGLEGGSEQSTGGAHWQHPTMHRVGAVATTCAMRGDGYIYVLQRLHWCLGPFASWRIIFLEKVGWKGCVQDAVLNGTGKGSAMLTLHLRLYMCI